MDTYDMNITQGSTLYLSVTAKDSNGTPINLSGYALSGYLKFKYSDSGHLLSLNPTIVIPESGNFTINIAAADSANLPITIGVYDVEAGDDQGNVTKLLKGRCFVSPEVTY